MKKIILLVTLVLPILVLSSMRVSALFEGSKDLACEGVNLNGTSTTTTPTTPTPTTPTPATPTPATPTSSKCDAEAGNTVSNVLSQAIVVFSVIVGVISVIMIIVAGLRYVTSGGDANQVASAKNTLLYAIVGIVIVVFAQIIVRFVVKKAADVPEARPTSTIRVLPMS
jgi:hypothetical protein